MGAGKSGGRIFFLSRGAHCRPSWRYAPIHPLEYLKREIVIKKDTIKILLKDQNKCRLLYDHLYSAG
jgi:hypothetical protein